VASNELCDRGKIKVTMNNQYATYLTGDTGVAQIQGTAAFKLKKYKYKHPIPSSKIPGSAEGLRGILGMGMGRHVFYPQWTTICAPSWAASVVGIVSWIVLLPYPYWAVVVRVSSIYSAVCAGAKPHGLAFCLRPPVPCPLPQLWALDIRYGGSCACLRLQ
jgi:hypothetical protein